MKRMFFATCAFLISCVCFSQTVVSRWHRIKNTRIEWSVVGSDTVYVLPVTDFSSPLTETIVLSFHGSSALMSTLKWLSTAELSDGDFVRLDYADDKNIIARASKNFSSGFRLFNKDGYLPVSVFWMKRFVLDDYNVVLNIFAMVYNMKNQNQNLTTTSTIDEIFLRAYARQGMSYSPLENDYYERPQSE